MRNCCIHAHRASASHAGLQDPWMHQARMHLHAICPEASTPWWPSTNFTHSSTTHQHGCINMACVGTAACSALHQQRLEAKCNVHKHCWLQPSLLSSGGGARATSAGSGSKQGDFVALLVIMLVRDPRVGSVAKIACRKHENIAVLLSKAPDKLDLARLDVITLSSLDNHDDGFPGFMMCNQQNHQTCGTSTDVKACVLSQ